MYDYVIALDMDGVLYPFPDAFNALYSEFTGERLIFDGWLDFSSLPGEAVSAVWNNPQLFLHAEPYEGAVDMVQGLMEIPSVALYIVTSPGRSIDITIPSKWQWLQHWMPFVPHDHFVTMTHKQYFRASMLIEDYASNVVSWLTYNPTGDTVLISRPWNESRQQELKNLGTEVMDLDKVLTHVYSIID